MVSNLQVLIKTMTFQNPNLVGDESFGCHEITHSDSHFFKTLTHDDHYSDQFAQLLEIPQGYSVSSPQTADFAARCDQGLTRNKLNQELTAGEKLQVLAQTLKPIPFMPSEALDFKSHESLLRRLGLWGFVNIEFDTTIRSDLLVKLIASYTPNLRGGYVNGIKIRVNRADLGRALKLPAEPTTASAENVVGTQGLAESVAFIEKLVSMRMLLHDDECTMPPEVLDCIRLIKEGHLDMIDWAGLIWSMVDKELMRASQLENCYYASHLQHLIKTQHEELLREEYKVDIFEVEEEQVGDDHYTDVDDFKEESGQWPLLQQCNVINLIGSEEGENEDEDDCILLGEMSSRNSSLGMLSGSFVNQAMEAGQIPLSSGNGLSGNFEDFFTHREDAHQMVSGHNKRYFNQDDYNLYQTPNVGNKRLRSDSLWEEAKQQVDFNMFMENIQHFMGEARMMYVAEAQDCEASSMDQQFLLNELQNRDKTIQHLRETHMEESQKGQQEVYRLEKELYKMGELLKDYRKALKKTQLALTEYKLRCQQATEPLYKDLPGSEGDGSRAGTCEAKKKSNK